MLCVSCGTCLPDATQYCQACGAVQDTPPPRQGAAGQAFSVAGFGGGVWALQLLQPILETQPRSG